MFNKVILIGNLTRDPEIKYLPSGMAVCDFDIAVNRKYRTKDGQKGEDTTFVQCKAWDKKAEFVAEWFKKGKLILVEGRLNQESWEDKQTGAKRSKLNVVGENFSFVGTKSDSGGGGGGHQQQGGGGGGYSQPAQQQQQPSYDNQPQQGPPAGGGGNTEDDLPF